MVLRGLDAPELRGYEHAHEGFGGTTYGRVLGRYSAAVELAGPVWRGGERYPVAILS